jgi:hypothetical protein
MSPDPFSHQGGNMQGKDLFNFVNKKTTDSSAAFKRG